MQVGPAVQPLKLTPAEAPDTVTAEALDVMQDSTHALPEVVEVPGAPAVRARRVAGETAVQGSNFLFPERQPITAVVAEEEPIQEHLGLEVPAAVEMAAPKIMQEVMAHPIPAEVLCRRNSYPRVDITGKTAPRGSFILPTIRRP